MSSMEIIITRGAGRTNYSNTKAWTRKYAKYIDHDYTFRFCDILLQDLKFGDLSWNGYKIQP